MELADAALRVQEEEQRVAEEKAAAEKLQRDEERREARAAARAQAKKEGRLLTGKAKKEAERMAAFRAQLLANADVDLPGAADSLSERLCDGTNMLFSKWRRWIYHSADPDRTPSRTRPHWQISFAKLHAAESN